MRSGAALGLFDRVYVINLPDRRDRRREMAAQLDRIGLSFEDPRVTLFAAVRPVAADGFPTVGTKGCFLSHLGVLEDACARSHQRILVLEDDVDFSDSFPSRWPLLCTALRDAPWQMFYGDHRCAVTSGWQTAGLRQIDAKTPVVLADCVGFQGEAIPSTVAALRAILQRQPGDPLGGPMHVDGAYNMIRNAHPAWLTLLAVPPIGRQRASRTDIHALGWRDTLPGVRTLTALARRWRNR